MTTEGATDKIGASAPTGIMRPALAMWARGKLEYEVIIKSRPDAVGMVDVFVMWSHQPARAHRGALKPKNEEATRLLALGEGFVTTQRSNPIARPKLPPKAEKPTAPRMPGARVDRPLAMALLGSDGMAGIPADARLRLLGLPNGAVALRAYDAAGLICERLYVYREPETKTPGPLIETTAKMPKGKALNALQQQMGKKATKEFVHPMLGVSLREVAPSEKLIKRHGSVDQARFALRMAQASIEPVATGCTVLVAKTVSSEQRFLISAAHCVDTERDRKWREIWAFADELDLLEAVGKRQGESRIVEWRALCTA